jgi:glycosyltransferase involved in cell wall biosynthesis
MRILFLTHYFPPEVNAPANRTFEHCRLWVAAGHEVTVVTCAPNHPTGKVYPGYENRMRSEEFVHGIRVIRLWTFLAPNKGFLSRTLNYLSYFLSVTLGAVRLPTADVVISTSPQFFCGLAGLVIRHVKQTPWVLEIRDLWPESILTVGAMRPSLAIRLLQRLESLAYRKAQRIVSVTDSFVSHINRQGGRPDRIAVIKNGVDLDFFEQPARGDDLARGFADKHALTGKFVAAYVGTHGMAHRLNTILGAAKILEHDGRIHFLLVGDGAEHEALLSEKRALGLANVTMTGQLPRDMMPAVWSLTDVSIIPLRRSELFKKVIPSKMFEAMAMRRPIVLGVEGEARELLEAAKSGFAVTPESPEELAAAIVRLADDRALAEEFGNNGRVYVEAHFDRRVLAQRYLELFEATLADWRATSNPLPAHPAGAAQR